MRVLAKTLLAGAFGLALAGSAMAQADKPLTILESVPGLNFPFFVHMMNQMKAEAEALGNITVIESDGQDQTPKQTADVETAIVQGVDGIVISPREVDAMAPAHPTGGRCRHSGRHHRPPRRQGAGHPGACRRRQRQGRRGPGRADHEALPGRRDHHQPAGHARREPGDRPQQGPSQRARQGMPTSTSSSSSRPPTSAAPTAFRSPNSALGGMDAPPRRHRRRQRRHDPRRDRGAEGPQHHRRRHHRLRRTARGAGRRCATARSTRRSSSSPAARAAARCRRWSSSCATAPSPSRSSC